MVFIHTQSRRVCIAPATVNPSRMWVANEAVSFIETATRQGLKPAMLIRDRDSKYGPEFDAVLKEFGAGQTRLPFRSPNLNAHVERFIKTLEVVCLDQFIVMGTRHLDHLVKEFTDYYNRQRPHSGIGSSTPVQMSRPRPAPPEPAFQRPDLLPQAARRRHQALLQTSCVSGEDLNSPATCACLDGRSFCTLRAVELFFTKIGERVAEFRQAFSPRPADRLGIPVAKRYPNRSLEIASSSLRSKSR